jgi:hypothetical protein
MKMRVLTLKSLSLGSAALAPPSAQALVPAPPRRVVMRSSLAEPAMPTRTAPAAVGPPRLRRLRPSRPTRVKVLPQQDKYVIHGRDLQRQEVLLPFGVPKATSKITAATLKRLVGGGWRDQLLRQVDETWVFVDPEEVIDLGDETQIFRLGRLQILS